ncbi:MAG: IS200/IS605 family transposase [Hydrococcus sp. Prado102]|jgi:putative transposase|nr:IS200/IS605 family transposase [Hydrococcus sp. Prado102]
MSEIQYRHQKTSVSLINYSFVWVTYERRKLLIGQTKELVEQLIVSKAKHLDCAAIVVVIKPESVYLFLNSHPDLSPKTIARQLKGFTSYVLRQKTPALKKLPGIWNRSYLVSTGLVSPEIIQKYIETQTHNCSGNQSS